MRTNQILCAALVVILVFVFGTVTPLCGQGRASASVGGAAGASVGGAISAQPDAVAPANQTQHGTAAPAPNTRAANTTMTARQKLRYGLYGTFLTPGAYLGPAVNAYFTERWDVKALGKTGEDKFADGLSRFGRAFATRASAELLGSGVYPVLFKQNPIYQPSGRKRFMRRMVYAASRTLLTAGDNGKTQPNFSRLLGNLSSVSLANVYERDTVERRDARGRVIKYNRRVGVGPTLESFGITTALDAVSYVVFDEFNVVGRLKKKLKRP